MSEEFKIIKGLVNHEILQGVGEGLRCEVEDLFYAYEATKRDRDLYQKENQELRSRDCVDSRILADITKERDEARADHKHRYEVCDRVEAALQAERDRSAKLVEALKVIVNMDEQAQGQRKWMAIARSALAAFKDSLQSNQDYKPCICSVAVPPLLGHLPECLRYSRQESGESGG